MTTGLVGRISATLRIDTVESRRFPALDGYRAVAALVVVTTHVAYFSGIVVASTWGHLMSRFDIGVTIFFLLSGFLLYRPWSQAALVNSAWPSSKTYFRRRLWRIVPAYVALVIVVLAVMPGIGVSPKHWLSHLTLTQIYWPETLIRGLTQTWSLATEITFYLALPVIAWLIGRRHRGDIDRSTRRQLWVLATCVVIAFVWMVLRTVGPLQSFPNVNMWLPAFMDWFAMGMFFALVHNRLKQPAPPRWMVRLNTVADDPVVCLVLAGAVFLLATTPLSGPYSFGDGSPVQAMARHYLYLMAAAAFLLPGVLGTTVAGTWRRLMSSPLMVYLGTISYGIFLWHLFALETFTHLVGIESFTGWFWLIWPTTIVLTIALAHASYVFIERPALRHSHSPGTHGPPTVRPRRTRPAPPEQQQSRSPGQPQPQGPA